MSQSITGIKFPDLEANVRAAALVGFYLQFWALMELEIDKATSKILGLTGLQQYVINPNLAFQRFGEPGDRY